MHTRSSFFSYLNMWFHSFKRLFSHPWNGSLDYKSWDWDFRNGPAGQISHVWILFRVILQIFTIQSVAVIIYVSLMSAKTHEREKCLRHCWGCDWSTACSTAWLDEKYFSSWPRLKIVRMWNNAMGFNGNSGFPPIPAPPANPSQQVGYQV